MTITPLGDRALLLMVAGQAGEPALARVQHVTRALAAARIPGVRETVPAFTSVALMLDDGARLSVVEAGVKAVLKRLRAKAAAVEGRDWEIPVCYDREFAPDLEQVAEQAELRTDEVISLHSGPEYRVHAIGFAPGFPYLAGLPERLQVPRRATPRTRVPAGSVAIGGAQAGVYPLDTPGGWRIIGRTPRLLFEPHVEPPAWLQAGDRVRFRPILREEFDRLREEMQDVRHAVLPGLQRGQAVPVVDVVRAGAHTMVQDCGRHGWQAQGVPVAGALDGRALRVANLLVGNAAGDAGLEWMLRGPVLHFRADRVVAVTGVEPVDFPAGRPQLVRAGERLDLSTSRAGTRGYLAISGGIDVPVVLGSRSTLLHAGFGGMEGRALRAGDWLATGQPRLNPGPTGWFVRIDPIRPKDTLAVRIIPGPHSADFPTASRRTLTESSFRVRTESDRMGLRLAGPGITRGVTGDLVSVPIAAGAIQVPPDGQPIVLLADRQTLGGYPQIAYVVSADLPRLAHARPGTELRFRQVTLAEAEEARLAQERDLAWLALGVSEKLSRYPV